MDIKHNWYVLSKLIQQECYEEPIEKCESKIVKIPKQEKEHKKKCLLTNDDETTSAPALDVYPTPAPNPTPSVPTYPPSPQTTSAPTPTYIPASNPTYNQAPQPSYQSARGGRTNQGFGRVLQGNFQG